MGSISAKTPPHILLYFIPGNPGLIGYYTDFLDALKQRLSWAEGHITVYGRDLDGFKDDSHAPFTRQSPPYNVEHQVRSIYSHLSSLRRTKQANGQPQNPAVPYDLIVLAGHSVGSYLALEVFHRHLLDPSAAPHLNLHAGILLFPTVTHIGESPAGKRLSLLAATPILRSIYHHLIRGFLYFWPAWVLAIVVSRVMKFSANATRVTVNFLKSQDGVWQALHMGQDEMRVIGEESWDSALWEMPTQPSGPSHARASPKFFFLFGENDHWVSDHFRANFISAREKHIENGWAHVAIDDSGLPHAFCVREKDGIVVAERAAGWLKQIWESI
ncbi:hypothetical protein B0T11DRAFT_276713 [Plectosphaerella cucumerina]|uniref:Lipid droplet-associated hydrolase n=1 Tax=Plectosphaerella cucumerina TaxID=40658 RepID=A0A8K0X6F6_9PEZI|nr:hypothetical protein B0T11DRAFT_276713 [Plectosphaerella cucumerina]